MAKNDVFTLRPEDLVGIFALVILGGLRILFWGFSSLDVNVIGIQYHDLVFYPLAILFLSKFLKEAIIWISERAKSDIWNTNVLAPYTTLYSAILHVFREGYIFVLFFINFGWVIDIIFYVHPGNFGWLLNRADIMIFGVEPSIWLQRFITPDLTELMLSAYSSTHTLIPLGCIALSFWSRKYGRYRDYRDLILGLNIAVYIGFLCYVLVPTLPPFYTLNYDYSMDIWSGPIGRIAKYTIVDFYAIDRAEFPSEHVTMSAVFFLFAFRYYRKLWYIAAPWIVLTWISTIYLRQHYGVDVLGGLVLAFFAYYISPKINDWWDKKD